MKKKVAFLGAGSHADAVLPFLDLEKYNFVGFFDDKDITEHDGYPILGKLKEAKYFLDNNQIDGVLVTIGDNYKRKEIFDYIAEEHYEKFINIISKHSTILTPEYSIKGRGIFIGHSAFIGSKAEIFDNNVINTDTIIEHHSVVKSHCNIAPRATINGLTTLEEGVYVGSGSIIIQVINIVKNTTIGAGAVVVKNIKEEGTYVGVPAKKLK